MPFSTDKNTEQSLPNSLSSNFTSSVVTLQAHVTNATQIRGSKGERTSSFIRVQFADFDYADSPIANEIVSPNYDFKYNLDLTLTDALLDTFLNAHLTITVYEVLPKDKNSILATTEIPLHPFFLSFTSDLASTETDLPPNYNLNGSITTNLNYLNPKFLNNSLDGKENQLFSSISVTVSLSKLFMIQSDLDQSNIIEFIPLELSPLPEEWGSKEIYDRDPNAVQAQYVIQLSIPMDSTSDRSILIPNGTIQTVTTDAGSSKKLIWPKGYKAYFSSAALKKLRECIMSNTFLEGEVVKLPMGKPVTHPELLNSKHKSKFSMDLSSIMQPEITSGHIVVETQLQDADDKDSTSAANKHRFSRSATNFKLEFDLKLKRSLISKKKFNQTELNIFDFIPRITLPKEELHSKRVALAETTFKETVDQLVALLSGMYVRDRTKFLQHLQDAGVHTHLKTTLKPTVLRLIKEKYPEFHNQDISTVLSEVYVYLTDLLNHQLTHHFRAIPLDPPLEDRLTQLKLEAEERESLRDWVSAKQLLLDRVCLAPDDLMLQLELAQCHGRGGDMDAALELLKLILNRHPKHGLALLTLGLLTSEPPLSETCFLTLLQSDPHHPTALTFLALHYDRMNQAEKADGCVAEATQLHSHQVFLEAADMAVKVGATTFAELALSHYALVQGTSVRAHLIRAQLHQQLNQWETALSCLLVAQKIRLDDPNVGAALGHLHYSFGQLKEAKEKYETLLALQPKLDDIQVLVRLATIYLNEALSDPWDLLSPYHDREKIRVAQQLFTQSKAWSWVGLACLALKQMEEAEAALCHATTLHARRPCGWLVLSVFHLMEGHIFEAEQCAHYALTSGLRNIELLRTAANAFHSKQQDKMAMKLIKLCLEIDTKDDRLRSLFEKIVASKDEVPKVP